MNLYCAFSCERRDNWQSLVPAPTQPGNIGEKKWLEERLPERWKELEQEAPLHFMAGRISGVVALDETQQVYGGDAAGFVGYIERETVSSLTLFSFDATERMRQLLWTVSAEGMVAPFWLWTGSSENRYSEYESKFGGSGQPKLRLVDLESVSGSKGQKIPWGNWVRAWGVNPETAGDNWQPIHTAEVVRGLARRMGYGKSK